MNRLVIEGVILAACVLFAISVATKLCESKHNALEVKELKVITNNNEKIINENAQVFKRKEVNRIIPVSDDLKWLRQHFTYN
jgi:predicted transcriptional regulator